MSGTIISAPAGFYQGSAVSPQQAVDLETAIQNATAAASDAGLSATAAASSASAASQSAASAASSLSSIGTAVSDTAASAADAANSASAASDSVATATDAATTSLNSQNNAASSADAASTSAGTASSAAASATTNATNSANSAAAAATSASTAASNATLATTGATNAAASAASASASAASATASATTASTAAATFINPNLLINSDFTVNQRNTGTITGGGASGMVVDTWRAAATSPETLSVNSSALSAADLAAIGVTYPGSQINFGTSGASASANACTLLYTRCYGVMQYSAKQMTLSMWVKASAAQGVNIVMGYNSGTGGTASFLQFVGTINATTTWSRQSVTFTTADLVASGFNVGTGNTDSLTPHIFLSNGTGFDTAPTNAVNGTVNIAFAKLEFGAAATTYQKERQADNYARCYEFYYTPGTIHIRAPIANADTGGLWTTIYFPRHMLGNASIDNLQLSGTNAYSGVNPPTVQNAGPASITISATPNPSPGTGAVGGFTITPGFITTDPF